ncbi:hypothetical protein SELMODRAFT_432528 [Selaginella moellendorffii]|uniref:Uncharacterized protein n=1 Tax=Selaginella moellendorffii TaxID=88036 RepID=D8TGA3_SELML|nr:hypothetical protein SELMODRAFT_432528 [Selaginella moellendorffii]
MFLCTWRAGARRDDPSHPSSPAQCSLDDPSLEIDSSFRWNLRLECKLVERDFVLVIPFLLSGEQLAVVVKDLQVDHNSQNCKYTAKEVQLVISLCLIFQPGKAALAKAKQTIIASRQLRGDSILLQAGKLTLIVSVASLVEHILDAGKVPSKRASLQKQR